MDLRLESRARTNRKRYRMARAFPVGSLEILRRKITHDLDIQPVYEQRAKRASITATRLVD